MAGSVSDSRRLRGLATVLSVRSLSRSMSVVGLGDLATTPRSYHRRPVVVCQCEHPVRVTRIPAVAVSGACGESLFTLNTGFRRIHHDYRWVQSILSVE